MSGYNVYAVEVEIFGEVGVGIAAAYANPGGYLRAESYLLIPDGETIYANKFRYMKPPNDSPIEINEQLMLDQAKHQIEMDLGTYFRSKKEGKRFLVPPNSPNLRTDSVGLLVHVWIRETCPHLESLYGETEYKELAKDIESILSLPPLKRERI